MKNIIEINSCRFRYDTLEKDVVNIESLFIKEGEHVFFKGKSGSGKSTFLNLLSGVLRADSGEIKIFSQDITKLSESQIDKFRADNYGIIFQEFNLLPYLSVRENISLACEFSQQKKENILDIDIEIEKLCQALEIPTVFLEKKAMNLSVGEQQRVAVARALLGDSKLIIADEPTSALDSDSKDRFMQLLFERVKSQNSTLLFVSHDNSLSSYFDRVYDFSEINSAF